MPVLLALTRSVALAGAIAAAKAGRRAAVTVGGYLFAVALFTIGLGFLTLSAYRAMAHALGDVYACLIVGCLYLVAGLVAMLVLQLRRR